MHAHLLMTYDVIVICYCVSFLPCTSGGESHCFLHAPMTCAVSVNLDCCVFSPLHYWEHMHGTRQAVSNAFPHFLKLIIVTWLWLLYYVAAYFLLPPTSAGESHSFPHAPMMCAVSVILDCCVFSPLHCWEHMEHDRQ